MKQDTNPKHTRSHTYLAFILVTGREERRKKKKEEEEVRDMGLETLGALFVNSHSDGEERETAGTQR